MSIEVKYTTEVTRKVFDDEQGEYVQVGVDSDGLGYVQISTSGDYFGNNQLVLPPGHARALAEAILAAADEMEKLK